MTGRLDLAGGVCVRLRGFADALAGPLGAGDAHLPGDLGGLPLRRSPLVSVGRLGAVQRVPDHQPAAFHSGSVFDGMARGDGLYGFYGAIGVIAVPEAGNSRKNDSGLNQIRS